MGAFFRKMVCSTSLWMTQACCHATKLSDGGRENALSWFHVQLDSWKDGYMRIYFNVSVEMQYCS